MWILLISWIFAEELPNKDVNEDVNSHDLPSQSCESEEIQVLGDNRNGATLYQEVCAACHQSDGAGLPDVFPSLQKTPWVEADPSVLATIILRGVSGKISVNGENFASYMSPYGKELSDQEIIDVVYFVQQNFAQNKDQPKLSVEDVTKIRSNVAKDGPLKGQSALDALLVEQQ